MGKVVLVAGKVEQIRVDSLQSPAFSIQSNATSASLRKADDILTREVIAAAGIKVPDDQMLSASMDEVKNTSVCNRHFQKLFVSGSVKTNFINGRPIDELVTSRKDLTLQSLEVGSLVAPNADEVLKKREKRQAPALVDVDTTLRVKELFVSGRLNGVDFNDLLENALRTNAVEQRILAPFAIDTASARSVLVPSNLISDQNLKRLVSIHVNQTLIDQQVRFVQPLAVNELKIIERLNHINVFDGRLDALFKRSRGPQVITGSKLFQSIKLLEPIFQRGKIQINSPTAAKIKPIVTIDEDLVLAGDFSIGGNVTIRNKLIARNLFGRSGRFSVDQLLNDGLRVNEVNVNVPIEFTQPIRVENVGQGTQINRVSIDSLIKRNVSEIQEIRATKVFETDLYIENGFVEAYTVDGVDLANLNATILKKNAANQILNGTIHFRKITAEK